MKFIQVGASHPRNEEAFIRGCLLFNIEYQKVDDVSQITCTPDLIWSISTWIDPARFPDSKFLFGPQFFVFPSKDGPLATCQTPGIESRCFYNCLSDWNINIHNVFAPNPKIPYICLPFGVNTDSLRPNPSIQKQQHILVYWKQRNTQDLQLILDMLRDNSLTYRVITYGHYDGNEYHSILQKSKVSIWVGCHESQGFAFQEALSLDVPLLVYDVNDMKQEVNGNNQSAYSGYSIPLPTSAASYWDPMCGEKTTDPSELDGLLKKMLDNLDMYKPREFVERELSDRICFKRLLKAFNFDCSE
jgi:hypothetical protein